MDRRDFLKTAAFTAAGAVLAGGAPLLRAAEPAASGPATATDGNAGPGMRYRPMGMTGVSVSALGFGMMRPPALPDGGVDEEAFRKMVRHAIDNGLNYIDTSYVYSGGKSEEITGRILADGYRRRVNLASKLWWPNMQSAADFDRLLNEQLERLQTDHLDFYLVHAINANGWKGPIREFKIAELMAKAKEQGKIRNMGFSFHASLPVFREVLDAGPGWDFYQHQLNYVDTEYEAGHVGMKYAADRGLGVIAMEPLRGGFLANMPPGVKAIFDRAERKRSDVEWAFDYLWDMPEISLVLSGMSAMQHVVDNLEYAGRAAPGMLTPEERRLISLVTRHLRHDYDAVGCVGCEYCKAVCPEEVAVAQMANPWNQYKWNGDKAAALRRIDFLRGGSYGYNDTACTLCGACLPACPYGVDIPGFIKEIRKEMRS